MHNLQKHHEETVTLWFRWDTLAISALDSYSPVSYSHDLPPADVVAYFFASGSASYSPGMRCPTTSSWHDLMQKRKSWAKLRLEFGIRQQKVLPRALRYRPSTFTDLCRVEVWNSVLVAGPNTTMPRLTVSASTPGRPRAKALAVSFA